MSDVAEPRAFYDTELYKLLVDGLPVHVSAGRLDVRSLADKIEYSYEGIYKWLRAGRVSIDGAKAIARESGGLITLEELTPFVFA